MLQQRAQLQAASMNTGPVCSTSGRLQTYTSITHPPCPHHRTLARQWAAAPVTPLAIRRNDQPMLNDSAAALSGVQSDTYMPSNLWSRLNWELLLLVSAVPVPAALAEEGLKYNAEKGEGIVKTLSGVAYIGLLLYFLTRVLNRRARKAREEVRSCSAWSSVQHSMLCCPNCAV